MILNPSDLEIFYRLHPALLHYVNEQLKVIPNHSCTLEEFCTFAPAVRLKARDALTANLGLIDSFVAQKPAKLSKEELEIVSSWRHLVAGRFYMLRKLKKYTVFLSTDEKPTAYGVLALTSPFDNIVGPNLPILTQTVLLPFKDKIVYDGLITSFPISFGSGIRRSLNASYTEAKERVGIVTSLPISSETVTKTAAKAKRKPAEWENDWSLQIILGLIDQFCKKHLNEDYAVLCRKLAEKLARKRPSPLRQGVPNAWASGIIKAIGGVNYLHDKSQKIYMRSSDIDYYLGVSTTSGSVKLAAIRKMRNIDLSDPIWYLPRS